MHAAATVLLAREGESGLEVLMMRRASAVAFMGGMWVFPGGRLDAADHSAQALARITGAADAAPGMLAPDGTPLPADTIAAHLVAACREAFEEAGVLLVVDDAGSPCGSDRARDLATHRETVTSDASAFVRLLESERLRIDAASLVYWSHWITPSAEPKRFDTRFFVAALPAAQDASADRSELTEHAWMDPATAAEAVTSGRMKMAPPTLLTLEDLTESYRKHGSLDRMLAAETGRPVPPIMPRFDLREDSVRVVMPWDAA